MSPEAPVYGSEQEEKAERRRGERGKGKGERGKGKGERGKGKGERGKEEGTSGLTCCTSSGCHSDESSGLPV